MYCEQREQSIWLFKRGFSAGIVSNFLDVDHWQPAPVNSHVIINFQFWNNYHLFYVQDYARLIIVKLQKIRISFANRSRIFVVEQKWCSRGKMAEIQLNRNMGSGDGNDCSKDSSQIRDRAIGTRTIRRKSAARVGIREFQLARTFANVCQPDRSLAILLANSLRELSTVSFSANLKNYWLNRERLNSHFTFIRRIWARPGDDERLNFSRRDIFANKFRIFHGRQLVGFIWAAPFNWYPAVLRTRVESARSAA